MYVEKTNVFWSKLWTKRLKNSKYLKNKLKQMTIHNLVTTGINQDTHVSQKRSLHDLIYPGSKEYKWTVLNTTCTEKFKTVYVYIKGENTSKSSGKPLCKKGIFYFYAIMTYNNHRKFTTISLIQPIGSAAQLKCAKGLICKPTENAIEYNISTNKLKKKTYAVIGGPSGLQTLQPPCQ